MRAPPGPVRDAEARTACAAAPVDRTQWDNVLSPSRAMAKLRPRRRRPQGNETTKPPVCGARALRTHSSRELRAQPGALSPARMRTPRTRPATTGARARGMSTGAAGGAAPSPGRQRQFRRNATVGGTKSRFGDGIAYWRQVHKQLDIFGGSEVLSGAVIRPLHAPQPPQPEATARGSRLTASRRACSCPRLRQRASSKAAASWRAARRRRVASPSRATSERRVWHARRTSPRPNPCGQLSGREQTVHSLLRRHSCPNCRRRKELSRDASSAL